MSVADRLKTVRTDAGLSQKELADKLGMPLRTYGSYERGERDISTAILLSICKTLNVSSDYLLGRAEINSDQPAPPAEHFDNIFPVKLNSTPLASMTIKPRYYVKPRNSAFFLYILRVIFYMKIK